MHLNESSVGPIVFNIRLLNKSPSREILKLILVSGFTIPLSVCSVVIFANGDVPLCNVDYNNKYPTGSIMQNNIRELWQSKIMNARRKLHLNGNKKDISICANCNVWDEVKGEEIISPEFAEEVSIQNTK